MKWKKDENEGKKIDFIFLLTSIQLNDLPF